MDNREALIALSSIPSFGSIRVRTLIRHFGSPVAALQADAKELSEFAGFGPKTASLFASFVQNRAWKRDMALADRHGVQMIAYTDEAFPKKLLELVDHPLVVYMKGNLHPSDQRGVAVVGTRTASSYGREMARNLSGMLAANGYTVISGLARGIDTEAHQGALGSGRTIAVIGSGLSNIYPRENIPLADKIAENGAVLSEFSMTTPPDRQNFPRRNRLVSVLARACLLVEAPMESGAMITVEHAMHQGRKVFALPGRAVESFRGNHHLIKKGLAQLVETAKEVMDSLDGTLQLFPARPVLTIPLEPEEGRFLIQLPDDEVAFDDIAMLTKLPAAKLNVLLMSLVLKKIIKEFPGKIYKKIQGC